MIGTAAALALGSALAAYHGGQAYTSFKKGQSYEQMDRDLYKNTGRHAKYYANSFRSLANDQYLNAVHAGARSFSAGYGAGRTFTDFFKEDE